MKTTPHIHFVVPALFAFGLVHIACDRTASNKPVDAAAPDAGAKDLVASDQAALSSDLTGKDQLGPDLQADASRDQRALDIYSPPIDTRIAEVASGDGSQGDAALGDVPSVLPCGPGGTGCNDDPKISGIWGTCQPDGTCACRVGYEINPRTGRCWPMAPDASPTADAEPVACAGEYTACGCGCCEGVTRNLACYYPTLGQTLAPIKAADEVAKSSVACPVVTCNVGVRYVCCLPSTPEPTSSATYTTESYMGDMTHIRISKVGADCAQLSLSSPAKNDSRYPIDTSASWGLMLAEFGTCNDAGVSDVAKGVLGTVAFRASGDQCLVDVHVTLFGSSAGEITTGRLDVDGLVVKDYPASQCK